MAVNILDALKGQLGGALVGQLGKQVGINSGAAQSGIDAILPTILGGLMKKASTPSGSDSLEEMLGQSDFDGGLLEKLPGMLGGASGGDPSMMTNLGMTVLKSLFGENVAPIAALIAKFTGLGSDKSTSLLAILAPLVMSYLGAKKKSDGLNASGLASLLMSQKDSVAKSLPPGMAGALGLGSLGITDSAPAPAAKPVAAARPAATANSGGGMRWVIPILILGGLATWTYLHQNKKSTFKSLPQEKRVNLAEKIAALLEPLQATIDKLYAIPGVKPISEPIITNMQEKTASFLPAAQA